MGITLNRPGWLVGMYGWLEELEVRCLVLTGAPAFCSGDDVKQVMGGGGRARGGAGARAPRLTPAAARCSRPTSR